MWAQKPMRGFSGGGAARARAGSLRYRGREKGCADGVYRAAGRGGVPQVPLCGAGAGQHSTERVAIRGAACLRHSV